MYIYGSKSSSALLQLHAMYILWPRAYVHVYTQGNLKERKLPQAHNSSLAAHLPKVGRLLRITTHMLWTTPLAPWVGCMWFGRQRLWVYIPRCRMYTVSGQLWSLYMYTKPFQIDAWPMDSISCNFPIYFTGLQNELEENTQVLGDSTQNHGKPRLLVELRREKLRLGREGMSAFPWFPRHSESKIKTGSHPQSKIELTTGAFSQVLPIHP